MSALPVHDDQIIVSGENVMAEVKLALERVNVNSDTPVTVQVSGNSVVVTPIHDESRAADSRRRWTKQNGATRNVSALLRGSETPCTFGFLRGQRFWRSTTGKFSYMVKLFAPLPDHILLQDS